MSPSTIDPGVSKHSPPAPAPLRTGIVTDGDSRLSSLAETDGVAAQSPAPRHSTSSPKKQPSWLAPVGAGVLSLAIYCMTLAPTVTAEDSGELVSAAYFFGVPHPPGYPLWTMLCGVFVKAFPAGVVAWRANLFSAICSAIAIGLVCRCLILLRLEPVAAFAGALICASGRVLWSQSVIAEVYTLHFLLFSMTSWALLRWRTSGSNRWLPLASLLLGLGMSNHHTIAFSAVAGTAWVILQRPGILKRWSLILVSFCCFSAGFLPYTYIYFRARSAPPMNWGSITTVRDAWNHFSRRQYRSSENKQPSLSRQSFTQHRARQVTALTRYCCREYTQPLAALAVIGVATMLARRDWMVLSFWTCLFLGNAGLHPLIADPAFDNYIDVWCNQVFLLPVYACFSMAAAYALAAILGLFGWAASRIRLSDRRASLGIKIALACAIALVPLMANWRDNNMRHYWYAHDHAKNILDTMLPGAIIFPSGDHNTFPLIYLSLVEGYRQDVVIADKYGYIDLPLYQDMPDNPGKPRTLADRERIEEWVIRHARRPVYYTVHRPSLVPNARLVQAGILYHLLPETKTIDTDSVWNQYAYRNLKGQCAPRDFGADNILADWEYFQGVHALQQGDHGKARAHFGRCEKYGANIKEMLNNIGSALADRNDIKGAINYYQKAASMDRRYEAPRWNLARIHKSQQEFADAEQIFRELTEANPNDFRTWGELGFLAARRNPGSPEVMAYWNKSLSLNPSQPQIIEQLYRRYYPPLPTERPPASTNPTSTQPMGAKSARAVSPASQFGGRPSASKERDDVSDNHAGETESAGTIVTGQYRKPTTTSPTG